MFERRFDILVAGAGVAGAAAALEAARRGLKVALVEKTTLAGGLATSGLINVYLPLCDGYGRQVTFGIAEELLKLSIRYGPGDPPDWRASRGESNRARYRVPFSPASFALALDEALVQAGVEVWLDTLVCAAVMEGDTLRGVEIENKSGRGTLLAECVVDATGDADVAFRAGAPCAEAGNWLAIWALQASLDSARAAAEAGRGDALLDRIVVSKGGGGELAPPDGGYRGVDGAEVTRFLLDARRALLERFKGRYAEGADRRDLFPLALPSMATFRTTRRIDGAATLRAGGHGRRDEDSIGLAADWRRCGEVWEIPFGALLPQKVEGLLAAGRCVSSDGDAWHVTRVIPCAALTGQAAGAAAALAVRSGSPPAALRVGDVQAAMRERGVSVHLDE